MTRTCTHNFSQYADYWSEVEAFLTLEQHIRLQGTVAVTDETKGRPNKAIAKIWPSDRTVQSTGDESDTGAIERDDDDEGALGSDN